MEFKTFTDLLNIYNYHINIIKSSLKFSTDTKINEPYN